MTYGRLMTALTIAAVATLAACNKEQREKADSATGTVVSEVKSALTVIDIDMGRKIDSTNSITDKTDDFAPKDTIWASVHTSGTAKDQGIVGRWTYQDGSVLDEHETKVTTDGDDRAAFFIAKPAGLAKGTYTIHIMIDGKEVRTKDVTVK